jgi:hypothetical protein
MLAVVAALSTLGGCDRPVVAPRTPLLIPVSPVVSSSPKAGSAATEPDAGELGSLAALVVALKEAPPAALRALVSPAGLESCTNHDGEVSCGQQPLADAELRKLQDSWIPFGSIVGQQLLPPICGATSPTRVECHAATGGPEGVEWDFEKQAAGYRLVRVLSFWMSN